MLYNPYRFGRSPSDYPPLCLKNSHLHVRRRKCIKNVHFRQPENSRDISRRRAPHGQSRDLAITVICLFFGQEAPQCIFFNHVLCHVRILPVLDFSYNTC